MRTKATPISGRPHAGSVVICRIDHARRNGRDGDQLARCAQIREMRKRREARRGSLPEKQTVRYAVPGVVGPGDIQDTRRCSPAWCAAGRGEVGHPCTVPPEIYFFASYVAVCRTPGALRSGCSLVQLGMIVLRLLASPVQSSVSALAHFKFGYPGSSRLRLPLRTGTLPFRPPPPLLVPFAAAAASLSAPSSAFRARGTAVQTF